MDVGNHSTSILMPLDQALDGQPQQPGEEEHGHHHQDHKQDQGQCAPCLQAQQLPLLGLKVLVTDDALVAQGGQLLQF
jgi:hypothetical protein